MAFSVLMEFRWRKFALARIALVVALAPVVCAQTPAQDAASLPRGVVIPEVHCAAKPEQSYAFFLPSKYSPDRVWPVIFAFDPGARGHVPVELLRVAAEKYGFIVAGSNNSRNGPFERSIEAADAMMQDVSHRFALDLRRLYTTGFSGGSRVAALVAQICNGCVAGVFANGAGFPTSRPPTEKSSFAYFAAVGDLDFNYYELVELEAKLDALSIPNRLRKFSGPHQWAPPEVAQEAVEWFELMAMKQGRREKDSAFIARLAERAAQKVDSLEKSGDLYTAWQEVRKLALEFEGLADAGAFARRAAELKDSPAVLEGARRERSTIEEQRRAVEPIEAILDKLPAGSLERAQVRPALSAKIALLREQVEHNKVQTEKGKALRRAQSELFAHAWESAMERLRTKDLALAIGLAEVAAEITPESPSPYLVLARAYAQSGKKKETLRALGQALAKDFPRESLAAFLTNYPEFAAFRELPEFQKLVTPRR